MCNNAPSARDLVTNALYLPLTLTSPTLTGKTDTDHGRPGSPLRAVHTEDIQVRVSDSFIHKSKDIYMCAIISGALKVQFRLSLHGSLLHFHVEDPHAHETRNFIEYEVFNCQDALNILILPMYAC